MDKKIYIRDILKDDILANLTKDAAKDSYDNFHDFEKRRPDYLHYHLAEFVDTTMLARDSRALRNHIKAIQPDIDLSFKYTNKRGQEKEIDIPIGVGFFWPDVDV